MDWATFFGWLFFTNASGHPDARAPSSSGEQIVVSRFVTVEKKSEQKKLEKIETKRRLHKWLCATTCYDLFLVMPFIGGTVQNWRLLFAPLMQGCQMVWFQTQNPNLGIFRSALDWKMCIKFYGHLEYFMEIWDILWPFTYQEKSGNPALMMDQGYR
jgi:hypothetical protein